MPVNSSPKPRALELLEENTGCKVGSPSKAYTQWSQDPLPSNLVLVERRYRLGTGMLLRFLQLGFNSPLFQPGEIVHENLSI